MGPGVRGETRVAEADLRCAVAAVLDRGTDRFIAEARLRPIAEILNEADLIDRYHWAVVDARGTRKSTSAGLNAGVVRERHDVLNWLIGYMGQEWDDISTDT